jgi:phage terminase large subunit-like protein
MGMWMQLGGRGTGKTDGGSHYLDEHMEGPPCDPRIKGGHRAAIVAPTLGDAVDACVTGPSGVQTLNAGIKLKGGVEGTRLIWPNGSTARLFGAYSREDVERLRAGGNRCLVWLEEAAAMRFLTEVIEHTSLGLRIGPNPHYIASTTPKPRKDLKALINEPTTIVTRGRTSEAIHLAADVRAVYVARYGGTRIGRQELDAELLDDNEGALWTVDLIEAHRVDIAPMMDKVVVGVDPPGGIAECGIVVVGLSGHDLYILGDFSGVMSPGEWGTEVVRVARLFSANYIVVEKNYGGTMVVSTITNAQDEDDLPIPVHTVTSKQGKALRAEPVAALYEVGRVHHVGHLADVETQQTEWVPDSGDDSPDRLDALVHACTDLAVRQLPSTVSNPADYDRLRGATNVLPFRRPA